MSHRQIIVRPNESLIGKFPNEDAQSLVFDDTNLFAIDKYSGYDRVEGGTRANVGVQYTANIHRYGTVNALFGQSYHLAGKNSFAHSGQFDGPPGYRVGYIGLDNASRTMSRASTTSRTAPCRTRPLPLRQNNFAGPAWSSKRACRSRSLQLAHLRRYMNIR